MAGGIVGPPFEEWVSKQIDVRQKINRLTSNKLGLEGTNMYDVLRYQNSNTAFLRLSSGVNIDSTVEGISDDLKDNKLAKAFQLFSTRFTPNLDSNIPEFATGVELGTNSAYGWKSTAGYGFVPPPGLVSADIKSLNQGSLRDTTIQILCHSQEQFEIIEKLYLRLGYTMLLEWGWAFYFNNDFKLENSYHNIATDDFFFNNSSYYLSILNQIEADRKNSNGNYDALVGVVKNYSWNLEKDGSYNITLSLISAGSVIDSIKSNVTHNTTVANTTATADQTAIEYNKEKSTLNKILYYLTTKFSNTDLNDYYKDGTYTTAAKIGEGIGLTPSQNNDNASSPIDLARFPFNKLSGNENNQSYKGEYYIKLGCLLRTIQNFILFYSKDNNNQALIDFDFDPENNFMFTIPRQISLDPRVCLIQPSSKVFENLANPSETTFDRQKSGFYAIPTTYSWQSIEFKDDKNEFGDGKERLIVKDNGYSKIEDWYGGTDSWLYDQPDFEGNTANNKTEAENFLATNIKPSVVTKTIGEKVILGDDKIPEIFKQNISTPDLQGVLDVYTDRQEGTNDFFDKINPILNGGAAQAGGFSTFKKQYELQSGDVGKTFLVSKPSKTSVKKTFASDEGGNEIHNITITISTYSVTYWKIDNTVDDQLTADANKTEADSNNPNYNVNVYKRIENSDFRIANYDFIGKSMNILVNMNYIAQTLEKYVDISTGNISLYSFLDKLLVGIQNALGNINNFNILYNEDKNSFKIVDRTFIPGMNQYKPDLFKNFATKFITHTLDTDNGSFVRDASVKTKLSNNFAAQVSIGAQANGNVVGENATALSKWNKGLIDRINKDKGEAGNNRTGEVSNDYLSNVNIFTNLYGEINQGIIGAKQVDGGKNPCIDLFKYEVGTFVNQDIIPGVGFLPIDLELTMDGLSGMKLFESYTADDRLLPFNYRDRIQFIVTGLSHKIANNDWTTTVTSISGPKWDGVVAKDAPNITILSSNAQSTQASSNVAFPSPSQPLPPGSASTSKQKELIKQAASDTHVNTPPDSQNKNKPAMCGRGTYNIARNLIQLQKGKNTTQGQNIPSGGNANKQGYWDNLKALGYTQYTVGNNLTKDQVKTIISSGAVDASGVRQPWVEGDVLVYYTSDGKLFHTQIYVGDWNTSKWSCDRKNNYSTGFVYGKYANNNYTFLIFKAPVVE